MSNITEIETLVRHLINDYQHTMMPGDIFTYENSSVFTLTESNVNSVTAVLHNDIELGSGDYSFDSSTNKLTVSASLTSGDTIEIQYTYYPNYSSTEIEQFVRAAVINLSINHYYTFEVDDSQDFYPQISDKEKNLVAFIAAILIDPDNKSYRLPDMSITVPKSLPTRDLVSKAVAIFKHNTHGLFEIN